MIESLVAILLLVTIGYCVILNARLKRLKADEQALKATISELITATEIAERADRRTESDRAGGRPHARRAPAGRPTKYRTDLDRQLRGGEAMLSLLGHGGSAAPPAPVPAAVPADWPDPKAVAAAAQAFAERARGRARDRAAGLAA